MKIEFNRVPAHALEFCYFSEYMVLLIKHAPIIVSKKCKEDGFKLI